MKSTIKCGTLTRLRDMCMRRSVLSSILALEPTVCLASITCELRLRVSRLRMPKLPSRHLRLLQRMVPYLHLFCCFTSVACNSSSWISSWRLATGQRSKPLKTLTLPSVWASSPHYAQSPPPVGPLVCDEFEHPIAPQSFHLC